MGALTENHRCPRLRLGRVTDALSTVAIGGVMGALFSYAIEERPSGALTLAAAALGGVLARAVRDAIGPRF